MMLAMLVCPVVTAVFGIVSGGLLISTTSLIDYSVLPYYLQAQSCLQNTKICPFPLQYKGDKKETSV